MPEHQPIDIPVVCTDDPCPGHDDDDTRTVHIRVRIPDIFFRDLDAATVTYAAPDVLINADAGTVLAESIAREAFPQRHVIGADTDSLGYPVALGYDQPGTDRDCSICESERTVSQSVSDAISTRLDRAIAVCDEYTGPDLDLDAVIAAANDATRGGAIRHDYLAALRERGAIRATNHRGTGDTNHGISDAQHAARYLDDEPGDPFYD